MLRCPASRGNSAEGAGTECPRTCPNAWTNRACWHPSPSSGVDAGRAASLSLRTGDHRWRAVAAVERHVGHVFGLQVLPAAIAQLELSLGYFAFAAVPFGSAFVHRMAELLPRAVAALNVGDGVERIVP